MGLTPAALRWAGRGGRCVTQGCGSRHGWRKSVLVEVSGGIGPPCGDRLGWQGGSCRTWLCRTRRECTTNLTRRARCPRPTGLWSMQQTHHTGRAPASRSRPAPPPSASTRTGGALSTREREQRVGRTGTFRRWVERGAPGPGGLVPRCTRGDRTRLAQRRAPPGRGGAATSKPQRGHAGRVRTRALPRARLSGGRVAGSGRRCL